MKSKKGDGTKYSSFLHFTTIVLRWIIKEKMKRPGMILRLAVFPLLFLIATGTGFSQTKVNEADTSKKKTEVKESGEGEKNQLQQGAGEEQSKTQVQTQAGQTQAGQTQKGTTEGKDVKQISSTKPDMTKARGARPPDIIRPSGSVIPKGIGRPGGIGRRGGR